MLETKISFLNLMSFILIRQDYIENNHYKNFYLLNIY